MIPQAPWILNHHRSVLGDAVNNALKAKLEEAEKHCDIADTELSRMRADRDRLREENGRLKRELGICLPRRGSRYDKEDQGDAD